MSTSNCATSSACLERPIDEERRSDEAARVAWLQALVDAGLLDPEVVAAVTKVAEPGTVSPRRDNFHTRVEPYVDRIVEALLRLLGCDAGSA